MNIITDTNIWYNIAEGKYSFERLKSLPLCLTALNILELIITPKQNHPKGKILVRKACVSIKRLNPKYIEYFPLEFISRNFLDKKINQNKIKIGHIDRIINDDFSQEDRDLFSKSYNEIKQGYKIEVDSQQVLNRANPILKSKLPNMNEAVLMAINDTVVEIIKNFKVNIPPYTERQKLKIVKDLELYFLARASLYQKITLKGNQVAKNDQQDLYNMVYVGADDKYWTDDDKWIRKIYFQGIEKYLFKLANI